MSRVKRAEIIQMRLAGKTLDQVAEIVGLSNAGVSYHEQAWLAEQTPSVEVTEERRQKQLAGIDSVKDRLFSALEAEDELAARLAVVDRIAKLWDREARLVGLDLQPGLSVHVTVSAEQMAAVLWGADDAAVDVDAVELPADGGES